MKYKKNPTKLFQVRLSEKEYKRIIKFIKGLNVTRREWIIAVLNELEQYNLIRGEEFWDKESSYAYANRDKYNKKVVEGITCEICRGEEDLVCHHHYGYKGDNAFKVNILCRWCHSRFHAKKYKELSFNAAKKQFKIDFNILNN